MKNKEKNPMLKLLQTTALLFFTASLAAAPHFTLKNSLEKQGGEAQIITPQIGRAHV